jgi:Coenzyme PQQ synthesis protein D (PqqD)
MSAPPKKSPRFRFVAVGEEGMLYDKETQDVVHLDASSCLIWSLADGTRDEVALAKLLSDAYPSQREQIVREVPKTLATMRQQGLLV